MGHVMSVDEFLTPAQFEALSVDEKLAYIQASYWDAKALGEQSTAMEHLPVLLAEINRLRQWLLVIQFGRAGPKRSGYQFPDSVLAEMHDDIDAARRGEPAPEPRSWEQS